MAPVGRSYSAGGGTVHFGPNGSFSYSGPGGSFTTPGYGGSENPGEPAGNSGVSSAITGKVDPGLVDINTVLVNNEGNAAGTGMGARAGAWLGGARAVLLMQSSGVGNCINMLTLTRNCRLPLLMLVTMRGE